MLDPEKTRIAVGIALISCLGAEIHAFEVKRPPSWIYTIPVWSHSLLVCPNGKLDPETIGIAVGILLVSCLAASIHQMHVSPLPDKISTKFQRLCLCFRGLAFHWKIREDYATKPEL